MPKGQFRLFLLYFISFLAALAAAVLILRQMTVQVQQGQYVLLLLPPLGGLAVFQGLFPLLSKLRLGLGFVGIGGGLTFGLGGLLAGVVWLGLLDPASGLVLWLVGVFGPGWWFLSQWAERIGYFE